MLLSFLVVVTPFGVLIYYATDALVEQSAGGRVLAKQALEVTRRGQRLEGLAEDITRSARQYQILAKPEIEERLTQYLFEYKEQLAIHSFILTSENKLSEISTLLAEIEQSQTGDANSLLGLTREVNNQIDLILDKRLQSLNETAYQTQTQLSTLAIVLLIIEMLLILFFSFSIIRPVRRQRFLRHMSHELKTPLTTLREGSDLLADQITGPLNKNQMEITQLLQSNSRQLQSLIEQLLDYSRLHQNEPINLHLVALLPALNEAIEPYKLLLEQKRIQVALPESEQEWMTDRAMLIRIIGNLVSNAALYGSDNGHLILQIQSTDSECVISVENDGPTIPEKDVPQLFEPFYQGQNRRQGPVKGSGIGLSIVRDAAESLGANVELSTNENNRVGFSLYLPVLEQHLND